MCIKLSPAQQLLVVLLALYTHVPVTCLSPMVDVYLFKICNCYGEVPYVQHYATSMLLMVLQLAPVLL